MLHNIHRHPAEYESYLNNSFQTFNSLSGETLISSDNQQRCMDSEENKKPGLMYFILMLVAIGCVVYGLYGWITGLW